MRLKLFLVMGMLAVTASATDWSADGQRWWSHIKYLASDELEGRNTGSEGHRKAAAYVAGEFQRAGLKPAGTDGYLQPVAFNVRRIDEPNSSLNLIRDGLVELLKLGEDARLACAATWRKI